MILNIRIEQEFDLKKPIDIPRAEIIFCEVCKNFDLMLDTKKKWYEKGYSRKQALQRHIFFGTSISDEVKSRWKKRYKNNYLFLVKVYGMASLTKIARELI